jgi:hypothetical protein
VIQVIFALMPTNLLGSLDSNGDGSKVFAYSQKTRCLKLFTRLCDDQENDQTTRGVYKFFLDVAGVAWELYEKWKTHPGFRGTRLRSIERESGKILDVPDGIVFPILGALSAFFVVRGEKWIFKVPSQFDEKELIDAAASAYIEIASHNPQTMGKSKACYSTERVRSTLQRTGLTGRRGTIASIYAESERPFTTLCGSSAQSSR